MFNKNATKEFPENTTDTYPVGMTWNILCDHCLIGLNAKGVLNFRQYFKIEFDQTLFLSFICLVKVFSLSPKLLSVFPTRLVHLTAVRRI